jgi:COMPASS component SWD1
LDWTVAVYDVSERKGPREVLRHTCSAPVVSSAIAPDAGSVAVVWVGGEGKLLMLEKCEQDSLVGAKPVEGLRVSREVALPTGVTSIAYAPHSPQLAVGSAKGTLTIMSTIDGSVIQEVKMSGSTIKRIVFAKTGKHMLVNSGDRCVRLVDANTLEIRQSFVDAVNKFQWKCMCFSADNEHVAAGAGANKGEHSIYVWGLEGNLVKMLHHQKAGILDLDWHPHRPFLVGCSTAGSVHIWGVPPTENWSAYDPSFVELEENIVYEEREDEFDEETAASEAAKAGWTATASGRAVKDTAAGVASPVKRRKTTDARVVEDDESSDGEEIDIFTVDPADAALIDECPVPVVPDEEEDFRAVVATAAAEALQSVARAVAQ